MYLSTWPLEGTSWLHAPAEPEKIFYQQGHLKVPYVSAESFLSFHFPIYWPLPVHFILTLDPLEEAGAEPLLDQLGHFASLSASRHLQINSG